MSDFIGALFGTREPKGAFFGTREPKGAFFGTREPKINGNVFNSATHIAEAPKKKNSVAFIGNCLNSGNVDPSMA